VTRVRVLRSHLHELHEDARPDAGHTACCTSGVRSDDSVNPVSEISNLARQVRRLRRQILLLDGAIVAACMVMLGRSLSGAAVADHSRFFAYWIAIFVGSLLALAISSRMWSEIEYLLVRSRWLASRSSRR